VPVTLFWLASGSGCRPVASCPLPTEITVGKVTEFVLPNQLPDDFVFGVSAVGADGHESLTSAYVSSVRLSVDVKVLK
jgi:hypothetical protein